MTISQQESCDLLTLINRRCTTPRDLASALANVDDNLDDLEGLEELDEESQKKVRESFKEGKVIDRNWKGVNNTLFQPY
jgi:hypothetical protein